MKHLLYFILIFPATCVAQNYQLGSSEKYRLEDSLFIEWTKQISKTYMSDPVNSDSFYKGVSLVHDSAAKFKKARHVEHIYVGTKERMKYYDSVVSVIKPELAERLKEQMKKDSTKRILIMELDKDNYN